MIRSVTLFIKWRAEAGEETRNDLSVYKFLRTRRNVVISRRVSMRGLIGRRRPLTAVITFNRLATCAARVSTADRISAEHVTTGKRDYPTLTLYLTLYFKRNIFLQYY